MATFWRSLPHEGNFSPAWWGLGGSRPPPFTLFTIKSKVVVYPYAPAERAYTLILFLLYPFLLYGFIIIHKQQQLELPETGSSASPMSAVGKDRPSQYKSRLLGHSPPAKLGRTLFWVSSLCVSIPVLDKPCLLRPGIIFKLFKTQYPNWARIFKKYIYDTFILTLELKAFYWLV
jgi:hypothetical protein